MGALTLRRGRDAAPVEEVHEDILQYLTFQLSGETYAIGILSIKEILEYTTLTQVPLMPAFIRGVMNLRGAVVPVLDIGLVVDSACSFFQELSYPEIIDVGVAISKLGNSSVQYDLAIFKQGHEVASAQGHFVHVFVDRQTRKSTPIPIKIRDALYQYSVNE